MAVCANCGQPRDGEYCSHCGQHFLDERLTLGLLWREFVQRFFNVEHGLGLTVRDLTRDPGGVVKRYVAGQRRRYLNPFTYLVLTTTMLIGVYALVGYEKTIAEEMRDRMFAASTENGLAVPSAIRNFMIEAVLNLSRYGHLLTIVQSIPYALLLWLFFRRQKITVVEGYVFALFSLAHYTLIYSLVLLVSWLIPGFEWGFDGLGWLGRSLMAAVAAFAAVGFFGPRIGSVLKTLVALGIATGLTILLFLVGSTAYVIYLIRFQEVHLEQPTLFLAAENRQLAMARELLDEGAEVNQTQGRTPLHLAAEAGDLPMVQLLVERGADLDAADHQGKVPLALALEETSEEHRQVARYLATAGTAPNATRIDGLTLLMAAARRGETAVLRRLLEAGADPNAVRDARRATALMLAADREDTVAVRLLLEHGADPSLANEEGETAADLTRSKEILALLGSSPNELQPNKQPPDEQQPDERQP